jgi:hypothetical protein
MHSFCSDICWESRSEAAPPMQGGMACDVVFLAGLRPCTDACCGVLVGAQVLMLTGKEQQQVCPPAMSSPSPCVTPRHGSCTSPSTPTWSPSVWLYLEQGPQGYGGWWWIPHGYLLMTSTLRGLSSPRGRPCMSWPPRRVSSWWGRGSVRGRGGQ